MTPRAAASHTVWAQTPERSNRLMMRVMTWISLRLGRRASRLLLYPIAAYFLMFAPASRRASRNYLRRVLGRTPRWRDQYRHFFTFAATVHDRLYLVNRRFDLFDVQVRGEDKLHQLLAGGKGVVLMGAHLGSFEVIRALGRSGPYPHIAMVMHEENAQKINAMLAAINPEAVHDVIGLGHADSMLKVWDHLEKGAAIGILADRTTRDDKLCPVPLLGDTADLPRGPFRMAAMLRRPVLFMTGLYLGGNRYAIHFDPVADFSTVARGDHAGRDAALEAAIVRYAALLEQYCHAAPYNWFNFFDFWQTAPAATTS
jgi:predicted LPLAT superfamily acyltransferase